MATKGQAPDLAVRPYLSFPPVAWPKDTSRPPAACPFHSLTHPPTHPHTHTCICAPPPPPPPPQVLMVAPTAFVFNDQAAQDNTFMNSAVNSFDPPGGAQGVYGGVFCVRHGIQGGAKRCTSDFCATSLQLELARAPPPKKRTCEGLCCRLPPLLPSLHCRTTNFAHLRHRCHCRVLCRPAAAVSDPAGAAGVCWAAP
jgi:hypothetical protein